MKLKGSKVVERTVIVELPSRGWVVRYDNGGGVAAFFPEPGLGRAEDRAKELSDEIAGTEVFYVTGVEKKPRNFGDVFVGDVWDWENSDGVSQFTVTGRHKNDKGWAGNLSPPPSWSSDGKDEWFDDRSFKDGTLVLRQEEE